MRVWLAALLFMLSARAAAECGIASWYGPGFHGRTTANGETFNQWALTAAHRTLPFGTVLEVARGERSVVVRVNDRGPYIAGRVIDLSRAAAGELGMIEAGVARVCIRRLEQ